MKRKVATLGILAIIFCAGFLARVKADGTNFYVTRIEAPRGMGTGRGQNLASGGNTIVGFSCVSEPAAAPNHPYPETTYCFILTKD
jgi:hypothetical protein